MLENNYGSKFGTGKNVEHVQHELYTQILNKVHATERCTLFSEI